MCEKIKLLMLFAVCFLIGKTSVTAQSNLETLITPPYLKAGDTVAIVAPSGILNNREDEIEHAKKLLKRWGLNYKVGKHVFARDHHFAGTDAQRCEDFQNALDDPTVSAIWCARGGYGTVRILDKLDYTKFKEHPKWLVGYSDITALHSQFNNEGIESIHGMMCVSLPKDESRIKTTISTFKDAIFGEPLSYNLSSSNYNKVGEAKGQLVGGNLTLLHTMLGSKTDIDTKGKIIFIEDIGEYKYHIDRMLQSLKRAGFFDDCAGVLVGDFTKLKKNNTALWGSGIEQLILDALEDYNFPIAFNMPAGHEDDNRAMILGREVEMDVTKEKTTLKFKN